MIWSKKKYQPALISSTCPYYLGKFHTLLERHSVFGSSKGIFIEAGDPFISFVNMRIIGSILSISSQEDWLYNLGKPLYNSQTDSLTQCFSCFLCITGTPVAAFWNVLSLSSVFPFFFSSFLDRSRLWEEEVHAGRVMCHM